MSSSEPQQPRRLLARKLYDGTGGPVRRDILIEMTGGRFSRVEPWSRNAGHGDIAEHDIVCPGLIDIQINGANDVQFNDTPTVEALNRMAIGAAQGGTAWILPTFITAPGRDYQTAMKAVRAAKQAGIPGILGLHLEGPFLSAERPGIHEPTAIRRMDADDLAALTAPFPGPLLLTVAPEELPEGAIERLTRGGVTVFAGHSAATHADMEAAERKGLKGATHLFNAMSQIAGREPGVVGSVLGSARLYAGIIADGHHVHWNNFALAARLMPDRLCLVTDAMCTLAGTMQEFDLHGERIRLKGGRLQNADGTLAGAHVAMDESIRNLLSRGITDPSSAVRMASLNPAAALGLDRMLGTVSAGFSSGLTIFDGNWTTQAVIRFPGTRTV